VAGGLFRDHVDPGGAMQNGNELAGVFVQTNERGGNRVIAFRRDETGALSGLTSHETGGEGDGVPHLTSQGSVVLSGDGTRLLVTSAGSDEISVFAVTGGELSLVGTVPTHGAAPKSVAEHDGLVYVLNAGAQSLVGFRLGESGLQLLENSGRQLAPDADPAQVGFSPDGSALLVTDRGANSLSLYPVDGDGYLGEPSVAPSSGPTPYGFAFAGDRTLIVTEAFGAQKGKAAASSYAIRGSAATPVSRSVGNGRSEICWAVVTHDDRYVFTTNFADGAVSRYAIDDDGSITLEDAIAGTAVEGETGLRDEGISGDGRFLYAVDADGRRIFGWAVGASGELDPLGSWEGVPATVAGLAAS
jgi:6-phosphogluconolactonase (cycloisomerase 2 family)